MALFDPPPNKTAQPMKAQIGSVNDVIGELDQAKFHQYRPGVASTNMGSFFPFILLGHAGTARPRQIDCHL
jgi:hypothetical protein